MNRFLVYIIATVGVCFFSCSKDEDDTMPTITVSLPVNLAQINGQDTVKLLANITDDRNIERASVSLRDLNGNQIGSSVIKSPNQKEYQLNELFFLEDVHLASGSYYFDFSASDGTNTAHQFVDVLLDEVPKQREGIVLVDNDGSTSTIYLLDNGLNASLHTSVTGDYLKLVVNSYNQQIEHSSSSVGKLSSIAIGSASEIWSKPIVSNHTSLMVEKDNTYLGRYDGTISGYDTYGAAFFTATSPSGFYAEEAEVIGDYYFSEQQAISSSNVQLALYWTASGALAQQTTINEDILGIYSLSQNEVILLTNNGLNQGNLIFYYLSTGLTATPFSVSLGQIDACTEIASGVYLVAESGNLTLLNANTHSTLPYMTGVAATQLVYDEVNNELFVVHNNQLTVYDYTLKSVKGTYTHSTLIEEIALWYNK